MEKLRKTNLLYWSVWLLVMACLIWVSTKIDFIFYPIGTFISTVFTPVLVAGFLYYIFTPFIEMLEHRLNIKRPIGILIVMVLLIGIVIFSFLGLIPKLVNQIGELLANLPNVIRSLNLIYQQLIEQEWVERLDIPTQLSQLSGNVQSSISAFLNGLTGSIGSVLSAVANVVLLVIIIPLIFFYMLKDGHKFPEAVAQLLPHEYSSDVLALLKEINKTIAKYISGQALVCLFVGTFTFIGYLLIGLPYAFLLGVTAAITNIIPYLGPYIGLIPAVVIGLTASPSKALLVCVVVLVVQQVESNIISPNVLGKTLDMHPLTILFLLLAVGKISGVLGMILAIPTYAVVKTIVQYVHRYVKNRKKKVLYKE
ncbi:AI-2E family transporter [uncultured Trichococcus sp.]|uniref:AI-2E family transporter n=1 Tax=uncultured Trichococcus sp. TaxID=189665 RepID=UPI0029C89BC0|nr:AI-2E family transporter [uncultured Trichococcus sp.]